MFKSSSNMFLSTKLDLHPLCDRPAASSYQRCGHLSYFFSLGKQHSGTRCAGQEHGEAKEKAKNVRWGDLGKIKYVPSFKFQVLLGWFLRTSISCSVLTVPFWDPLLMTLCCDCVPKLGADVRRAHKCKLSTCDANWSPQGVRAPQALQNKPWISNIYLTVRCEFAPHDILQLWSVDIAVLDRKCLKDGEKMHPIPMFTFHNTMVSRHLVILKCLNIVWAPKLVVVFKTNPLCFSVVVSLTVSAFGSSAAWCFGVTL